VTTRPLLTVTLALIAAAAVAGCSEESAGSPLPDDTVTTDTQSETTEPTTTEPSNERPRDITLDDTDPCTLIPQTDWSALGIERPGNPGENPNSRSPNCFYPGVGQIVTVVTNGIESWTEGRQNVEIEEAEPIEGFPTITVWNLADERSCYTIVDVADGQHLMAGAAPDPDDPDEPDACDLVYRMAESAMKTLVAS
jgi:hypothetical protein